jgi:hypothetical protein
LHIRYAGWLIFCNGIDQNQTTCDCQKRTKTVAYYSTMASHR